MDSADSEWAPMVKSYCENSNKNLGYIKQRVVNCSGNVLRRNCIIKHVTEGNMEENVKGTRR